MATNMLKNKKKHTINLLQLTRAQLLPRMADWNVTWYVL